MHRASLLRCLSRGQATATSRALALGNARGVVAAASRLSSSSTKHFYEPRHGHGLKQDPFNSIVAPRPIGWIGSISKEGVPNLAPYSFFNAFNYHPPIIGFSSIEYKDTIKNINETGNFTWNLATLPLATAMNRTSDPVAEEVDEFKYAGLTPSPSRLVTAPGVAESPVTFECRVTQVVQLQGSSERKEGGEEVGGKLLETWLVLGEVVAVHIDREVIRESVGEGSEGGLYDTLAAKPILRGGGAGDYFSLSPDCFFHMKKGQASPLDSLD